MDNLRMIGARVEPELKRAVRIEAAMRGMTVNDLIIEALRFFLDTKPESRSTSPVEPLPGGRDEAE